MQTLFEAIDVVARIVGYGAMVWGVVWIIGQDRAIWRAHREGVADREAMTAFEDFLKVDNPDQFIRYRNLKEWNSVRHPTGSGEAHWSTAAREVGVPLMEIIKSRVQDVKRGV